jgi:acyl-coenzyme A synthetase/AMP-(fatty) acid ligase
MNIVELVSRRAAERPEAIALEGTLRRYTYGELDRMIAHVAHHLGRQGVAPGILVGIGMQPSADMLIVLLALARLGAMSMTVVLGRAPEKRAAVAQRFGAAYLVSRREKHGVAGVPFLHLEEDWFRVPASFQPAPPAPGGDTPWRLNLTSGTTGAAKGITCNHDDYAGLLEHSQEFFPLPPGSRLLCHRTLDTAFELRYCMSTLFTGNTTVIHAAPKPHEFVDLIRRRKVTHAMITPADLQSLVNRLPDGKPHLPGLRALIVGGGVMSNALLEAAVAKLTPNVYDNHGASETGLTALGDAELRRKRPDVTGRLVPWVEAQTVDDSDQPLPQGEPGILRYRSRFFCKEYYKDPEATAKGFRGGWFYPGDIGSVADGLLALHSRVDDVINLGGMKVNPVQVEAILAQHPDVADAAVFALTGNDGRSRLAAAVVMRGKASEKELIAFCSQRIGPKAPRSVITVAKLPRNEAGKLVRRELPALAGEKSSATSVE